MASIRINQKALLVELAASEPILKKEADSIMRQQFFNPAIKKMKDEFASHPVTQEIREGIGASNISNTLDAPFGEPPEARDGREIKDYSPPNLTSFIGFEAGTDPTKEIEKRLDPSHADGPRMVYKGMDKNHLAFRFEIRAPSDEAIQSNTPLPFAPGISWAKRIEQGIPGIGHFLNALGRANSRSGGGIQLENVQLRSGRFKPVKYLSKLFNDFLRRASSGREPSG